jgi:hypothetical protein
MKRTEVFYHEICGKEAYKTLLMGVEEGFGNLMFEPLDRRGNNNGYS